MNGVSASYWQRNILRCLKNGYTLVEISGKHAAFGKASKLLLYNHGNVW